MKTMFVRFLRSAALAGLCSILSAPAWAVNYDIDDDVSGIEGQVPDNTTAGTFQVATNRVAYLKIRVDGAPANPGKITAATLRLKVSTFGSGSVDLYASNNTIGASATNWSEATLWTVNNQPYRDPRPLVNNKTNLALNQWMDFDVTDYISGDGIYTFALQSETGAAISFYSSNNGTATNQPQLVVTYNNTDAGLVYPILDLLDQGEKHIDRYDLQGDMSFAASGNFNRTGIFDVSRQPYNVLPTSAFDQRLQIQRAINDARRARAVVYFPAGTYQVGSTLDLQQGWDQPGAGWDEGVGDPLTKWNIRDCGNMLMGPTPASGGANTAKIVIHGNGDTFFGNAGAPQPLLRFWSRADTGSVFDRTDNQPSINYNQTIKHLDVDLTVNGPHPGAIGIEMCAAQGSSISDLTITATGATGGINGGTGPGGGIYHVDVVGGKYAFQGLSTLRAYSPLMAGCTFTGQTQNSIIWTGAGSLVVVGCEIVGKGIDVDATGGPWAGVLTLVDTRINLGAAGPAVVTNRNVYMNRVFVNKGNPVIVPHDGNAAKQATLTRTDGWILVTEYAGGQTLDQFPGTQNGAPGIGSKPTRYFVNGNPFNVAGNLDTLVNAADVATTTDRRAGHTWRISPRFNVPADVINVKDAPYNALGNGVNDDTVEIQNAINDAQTAGKAVFLPRGDYRISAPLQMAVNTTLFGINKSATRIQSITGAGGSFKNAGAPQPLIKSFDGTGSNNMLAEIALEQRMAETGAYHLLWRAGGNSTVKDVWFQRRQMIAGAQPSNFPAVRIEGNGGGKWWNFWITANNTNSATEPNGGYRHLKVSNTSQDLSLYMLNLEYAQHQPMAEFTGSSRIDFFQMKSEGNYRAMEFNQCNNFRVFGLAGLQRPFPNDVNVGVWADYKTYNQSIYIEHVGASNFLVANQAFQIADQPADNDYGTTLGAMTNPTKYNRLQDKRTTGTTHNVTTPGTEQFVVYKRGAPTANEP